MDRPPVRKADESKAPPTKMIRIKQIRSGIGFERRQKLVLKGLGLSRPGRSVILEDTPSIRGMIAKIPHLVEIHESEGK